MTADLKIDFVSDVSCPWCAIGLASLEQALQRLQGEVRPQLRFQPFELNPAMPPGGQEIGEHLTAKYGSTAEQPPQIRATVVAFYILLLNFVGLGFGITAGGIAIDAFAAAIKE